MSGQLVNDVHAGLSLTRVAEVVPVASLEDLVGAVRWARAEGLRISVAGGRHAMGGQAFGTGTLHLDTRPLNRVLAIDEARGLLEAEAGIQWPELMAWYQARSSRWGIRQKQTGADRLSLGGALAANIHGRGLALAPFVGDVEAFTLVKADGSVVRCSRREHAELFSLVIGGYGLFGLVYSVQLRLAPRTRVRRRVELRETAGLVEAFHRRRDEGCAYGDFQFEVDPASPGFLRRGIFACYEPAPEAPDPAPARELSEADWRQLLHWAHTDKGRAFEAYAAHYLATDGQVYGSDAHQSGFYPEGYHAALDDALGHRGSEMITELYVPREALEDFLAEAATALREADVIYGTVRLIERDEESFLAWAREPWACVVLNLHVDHGPGGPARAQVHFRRLIDLALARGGSYYLTYHRWASRDQVLAAHPRILDFLRLKSVHDPEGRFQSDWYRHLAERLAPRAIHWNSRSPCPSSASPEKPSRTA